LVDFAEPPEADKAARGRRNERDATDPSAVRLEPTSKFASRANAASALLIRKARMSEHRRLAFALLLSLLIHALLLSLTFGGEGLGFRASASPGEIGGSRRPV